MAVCFGDYCKAVAVCFGDYCKALVVWLCVSVIIVKQLCFSVIIVKHWLCGCISVTIARAIELKHSSGLVAALSNETATLYTDAGVYASVYLST